MTEDLRWVPAGDLKPGRTIIAPDEFPTSHPGLKNDIRRIRRATVERADVIRARKLRITTDRGTTIVSEAHAFLARGKRSLAEARDLGLQQRTRSWQEARNLRPGDKVAWVAEPWKAEDHDPRAAGYLAGQIDGEGCISAAQRHHAQGRQVKGQLAIGQNEGPVLDEIDRACRALGVEPRRHTKDGFTQLVFGRMWEALRVLGITRPAKMDRAHRLWEECKLWTWDAEILEVEDLGEGDVVALGTSTKTFFADGFVAHNSTVYFNECSQIPWDAVPTLWTRVAETSGLQQRCYYDCNPPGKSHWTHKLFKEGVIPPDEEPHGMDVASMVMNPYDNLANLSPEYIRALELLPRRQRERYLEGRFLTDVEGALWTDEMIARALVKEWNPSLRKTSVGVDPSVSNNPNSDECGIVVASLDYDKDGLVQGDFSGKMSTKTWAQRVVNLFHTWEANDVVAEKNQGGDLVADAIHHVDPSVPVVLVTASKGKFARAEPVSMLYEQGRVAHTERMPELEAELTESVLMNMKESPNRLDALVWVLTHLMKPKTGGRFHIG